jgi:hypothetical protein
MRGGIVSPAGWLLDSWPSTAGNAGLSCAGGPRDYAVDGRIELATAMAQPLGQSSL